MSVVITSVNMKGGVGKTSTCHHLAGALSKLGRRVLLVDNDPQSSLTQGFWGRVATRQLDPSSTIASLYAGDRPFPSAVIHPTGLEGVDLLPGSLAAEDYNVPRPQDAPADVQNCIRDFLDEAREPYDLVLVDCPPTRFGCSWAAMIASDFLIVPTQPEDYGAQALADALVAVDLVVAGPNPGLRILGYLVTMAVLRSSVHRIYQESLRAEYGAAVFDAVVPRSLDYPEAIAKRQTVAQAKPRSAAAKAVAAVADELLARLEVAQSASLKKGAA
ncbi:ParA family protein (plasmid) [Isosphaeraceae bacterium EP7]